MKVVIIPRVDMVAGSRWSSRRKIGGSKTWEVLFSSKGNGQGREQHASISILAYYK